MRQIIFLDIDGVVNVSSRSLETSDFRVGGLDLVIRNDLIDALRTLSERDDIAVAWLTTWLEHGELDELETVLNVSFLRPEVHPGSRAAWSPNWWKLPTLNASLDPGDAWVWVDDDLSADPDDSTRQMLSARYPRGRPVNVSGRTGLTPEHLAELVEWLDAQADDESLTADAIYRTFVERGLPVDELAGE